MAVRIRLSRIGKKHAPFFRVVAVDSRSKRDGEVLANIGTYNGLKSTVVRFDEELYNEWIKKGALPTDSAKKIYTLFKKDAEASTKKKVTAKPKKAVKKEEPKAEAPKEEVTLAEKAE